MGRWNQQGFQDVYTDIASRLVSYHDLTIVTMVALAVGISYFLVSCFSSKYWFKLIKKNEKVEFWWTILPAIWLIFLSYPSLTNLYRMECQGKAPAVAMVEVVGHQWYWSYSYSMPSPYFGDSFVEGAYHKRALSPSYSRWGLVEEFALSGYKQSEYSFNYDSYMLGMEDMSEGDYRLLEVDKRVIVPEGVKVLVSVTSADVLHSWCIPSMGIKMDAVPGKHNLVQFDPRRCGVFYGQCSELCGVNHSFMPIVMEVVPEGEFLKWVGIQSYLNKEVTYPLASLRVQWPTVEYDHKSISYWPQQVQDKVLSMAVNKDG